MVDRAGHDPLERLEVVVDVHRQAVRGDAAAHVDADRADLPSLSPWDAGFSDGRALGPDLARLDGRIARCPHAGQPGEHLSRNVEIGKRADHRCLECPHVRVDVAVHRSEVEDGIGDKLPGPVVGDLPAAVGLGDLDALHPVPVLAHRQVPGL